MAGRVIEVNTTTLRSDVSAIEEEINAINKGADRLANTLRELERMWEGNAKQAFSSAVNDDIRRLRELSEAIGRFTQKTGEIRREYDTCESEVAQIISSIRV